MVLVMGEEQVRGLMSGRRLRQMSWGGVGNLTLGSVSSSSGD